MKNEVKFCNKLNHNYFYISYYSEKKDKSNKRTEMIPVKVTDILHQWSRCKNLEVLKKLDQRFSNLNILGMLNFKMLIDGHLIIFCIYYIDFRKNCKYSETSSSEVYHTTSTDAGVFTNSTILSQRFSNTHKQHNCQKFGQRTIRYINISTDLSHKRNITIKIYIFY